MNYPYKKRIKLILILVLLAVVGGQLFWFLSHRDYRAETLTELAAAVVEKCRTEPYRPTCYDKEIPLLMRKITMEEAFTVTRHVQQQDASYSYCHVLGHELAAGETRKAPARWQSVVARCPVGVCSNGCIHGAFQERFRTEKIESAEQLTQLKRELSDVCEARADWSPSGMEQGSCYHALGHLVMYVTDADIPRSLTLCDELVVKGPDRDFSQLCYDGVFMQLFQPLEPEDFALIKGKEILAPQHRSFCAAYSGKAAGSCWTEGWPLHLNELQTPEGLTAYCAQLTGAEHDRCFRALVYVVVPRMNLDSDAVSAFCNGLPAERQGMCFGDAATRFMEIDYANTGKGVALCGLAKQADIRDECYKQLAEMSTYNFRPDAVERKQLCDALPERWQAACATRK